MQTRFSPQALTDPDTARAEAELRRCVHCGFCNARCPTYRLTGDELDSPRGRIYLMKEMLESGQPPSAQVVHHLDRCLSCLSCRTTCPSGVNYMQLIDHGRAVIEQTYRRPLPQRVVRAAIKWVFPEPGRFGPLMRMTAPLARLAAMLPGTLPGPLAHTALGRQLAALKAQAGMAGMRHVNPLPIAGGAPVVSSVSPGAAAAMQAPAVLVLEGCVQPALGEDINTTTRSLMARLGYRAIPVRETQCCGAIEAHLGDTERARARVRRNIDSWLMALDNNAAAHIVVTASGCGTMLKDYGHMLADDPAYKDSAQRLSAATLDISEWLGRVLPGLEAGDTFAGAVDGQSLPTRGRLPNIAPADAPVIAYHGACSLQHGQRIHAEVVDLLRGLGFKVKEPEEAFICCGSAGTYNLLQGEMADKLGQRKANHLEATGAALVVAGNLGCALQIERYSALRVVHLAELINWALAKSSANHKAL